MANSPSGIVRGTQHKAVEMDLGGNTPRQTQKSAWMGTGGKAPHPKGKVIDLTTPEIIDLTLDVVNIPIYCPFCSII